MQIGASGLPTLLQTPDNRPSFHNSVMRSVSPEPSASVVVAISNRNTAVSATSEAMKRRDAHESENPDLPEPKGKALAAYRRMENGMFFSDRG